MPAATRLPYDMLRTYPPVAYKEWAPIVQQLARGDHLLLLRKGGIAEGPAGFQPQHPWFWLYPTNFHSAAERLKPHPDLPSLPRDLHFAAEIHHTRWIEDPHTLHALDPYHGWSEEEILRRFAYGKKHGLFALIVRVWHTDAAVPAPSDASAAGCRSWLSVSAPAGPTPTWQAVLDEAAFQNKLAPLTALGSVSPCRSLPAQHAVPEISTHPHLN